MDLFEDNAYANWRAKVEQLYQRLLHDEPCLKLNNPAVGSSECGPAAARRFPTCE
jgi:hypothetical protein